MGHTIAFDILQSFKLAIAELCFRNLVQVCMDGVAVNWKFFVSLHTDLGKDANM
jgi:hypothetical protein